MRRLASVAVAALVAGFLAGCGGGGGPARPASGGGAERVPADAAAYVAIDSNLDSEQWRAVEKLAARFPGKDDFVEDLKQELVEESGLDYDDDVRPALGDEIDVVWLDFANDGRDVVGLTKPKDAQKFKSLVAKANRHHPGERLFYREQTGGSFVLAEDEETLDMYDRRRGGDKLADDAEFRAAMEALPDQALAKVYVDGEALAKALPRATGDGSAPFGLDRVSFISAALAAEDDGLRLTADAKSDGSSALTKGAEPYRSKLLGGVPADTLAVASFRGSADRQLGELRDNDELDAGLRQFERMLGTSLDELLPLLSHEVALYVRPAALLPEFDLALEAPDTQSALETLDKLAERVARLSGGRFSGGDVRELDLKRFVIRYAGFDGKVLLTTAPNGIDDYRGSGDKLVDDADFRAAKEAAGAPDETGGLFYVNLKDAIPLIESFLGFSGKTPSSEVTENLEPLRSFLAYGDSNGDLSRFTAFLEIK